MRTRNEEQFQKKKTEIMEKSFECFAENGLSSVGIRTLGQYCGCNSATLYTYFKDLDDLIVQSTAYCMSKVEEDFMAKAPQNIDEVEGFINEIAHWTAEKHGKKYRLMYQVYTHPKYIEYGKKFFDGVNERYTEYARTLESKIGIPYKVATPLIFILIRACVHYALFEDEFYLQTQIGILKEGIQFFYTKFNSANSAKESKEN